MINPGDSSVRIRLMQKSWAMIESPFCTLILGSLCVKMNYNNLAGDRDPCNTHSLKWVLNMFPIHL